MPLIVGTLKFIHHMCVAVESLLMKGWIECVGCADRSAYDLTRHSVRTNTKLVVRQALKEPVVFEAWEPVIDIKNFGPKFKAHSKALEGVIRRMNQQKLEECKKELEVKGEVEFMVGDNKLVVDKSLLQIERVTKKETGILLR